MIRRALALLAVAVTLSPHPATAQSLSLRLGGLHARYADSIVGDAGSIGARWGWTGYRTRGVIEGSWAEYTTGDAAGQGWTDLSFIGPASQVAAAGIHLNALANGARGGRLTGLGTAEVFGVAIIRTWTMSVGLGGGGVRTFTSSFAPLATLAFRAHHDFSPRIGLTASLAGTVSGTTRYADLVATADWKKGRLTATGLIGQRTGDLRYRPWAQAWAAWTLTPVFSLEGSAGTYPRDLTGFDYGRYVNLGLRVRIGARASAGDADSLTAALLAGGARTAGMPADILVEPIDSQTTRVTFRVADVSALSITGDWNEWTPAPLAPDGAGRWTGIIAAGSGQRRFALIDQDGRWIIPAGVTRLPDEFDGEAGLLAIP